CFKEETAKTESCGFGTVEHGFEGAPRRRPVASELRRLRLEQCGQGIARQVARGDAGIALSLAAIADANGQQAARERGISMPAPALPYMSGDSGGASEQVAQQRPKQNQDHNHDADGDGCDKSRGLGLIAEPLDRYRTGAIGQPGEAGSRSSDANDEEE